MNKKGLISINLVPRIICQYLMFDDFVVGQNPFSKVRLMSSSGPLNALDDSDLLIPYRSSSGSSSATSGGRRW